MSGSLNAEQLAALARVCKRFTEALQESDDIFHPGTGVVVYWHSGMVDVDGQAAGRLATVDGAVGIDWGE